MTRRTALVLLFVFVGGCVAYTELAGGEDVPSDGTVEACRRFRSIQNDSGIRDDEVVTIMQGILGLDTSRSVANAAEELAVTLEREATSTETRSAVSRMDAACLASDL